MNYQNGIRLAGTGLAFQNAIGFAITMISIQIGSRWIGNWDDDIARLLPPGPLRGVCAPEKLS